MSYVVQAATAALILAGAGAATVSAVRPDPPDFAVPEVGWQDGSALDGRVFYTTDTIRETGEVLTDELHFRDGTFQSLMCQAYCDFGWSDYQTWTEGETIHFTTTTRCPDAPHTVIWYGVVTGDEVRIEANWTTKRWYWTRQLNATGQGSTTPPAAAPDVEAPSG